MSWLPGCKQTSRDGCRDILRQHRPFMSIKSFVQHSGWQEMVSLCSLIRLIGVCTDRDQPEFLCSRSDSKVPRSPCGHSGRLLTHYRQREVRNSIYRYRKIHIDYRSKFSYRFYIVYIDNLRQHYYQCKLILTLPWYQSSHTMHWIISSSTCNIAALLTHCGLEPGHHCSLPEITSARLLCQT